MSGIDVSGWSCDERKRTECRNGHGCHCREITALRSQVERMTAALKPFVEAFENAEAEDFKYHNVTAGAAAEQLRYQDFERAKAALSSDERA